MQQKQNEDRLYKIRLEHLHLIHQNVPQKMTPWQAWWKTKESQTGPYSTHKKW